MAYKHNLFLSATEIGKFRMEVLADSVSVSKDAFLHSSMVASNFFHTAEEIKAVLPCSYFALLPPSPLPSSLAVGFKAPTPTMEGGCCWAEKHLSWQEKAKKMPQILTLLPLFYPILTHTMNWFALIQGCFLPWLVLSGKQSGSLFIRELILCSMALLL